MRPSTSTVPPSSSSRSSVLPGRGCSGSAPWPPGSITVARRRSRGVVMAVPVQPGTDVARRVERPAAQRAGRPALLHRGRAPGGHRPGLGGGEVQAGQVALAFVLRRPGLLEAGVVVLVLVVLVVVLLVGDRPLVQFQD